MTTKYTLRSASDIIKANHENDSALISAVDKLLGITMILSPVVFGPVGTPALALLGVKNELVRIGQSVYNRITSAAPSEDSIPRHERMGAAYSVVCYAAFFEAVDTLFVTVRQDLSLPDTDDLTLEEALTKPTRGEVRESVGDAPKESVATVDYEIQIPHPADGFDQQCRQLDSLYEQLTQGVVKFLESTSAWRHADDGARDKAATTLQGLPAAAHKRFGELYFDLAVKFHEFYIWANLHEHKEIAQEFSRVSDHIRAYIELTESAKTSIDVGFAKLADTVADQAQLLGSRSVKHVVDGLDKVYQSGIDQPIIDDRSGSVANGPSLSFPRKKDIFIPQSFQVLRLASPDQHLENEATWNGLDSRETLESFILAYLSAPYSLDGLLVILGHPGSGKSLLTEMLAARLIAADVNPIRVELRDVDAESEIDSQIEVQIRRDTGHEVNWVKLSEGLQCPPLVMLDGYDELLQASGRVFSNYLMKVRQFQRREAVQGRPVRVIITSRITLIDKAELPRDTTIVKT